MQIKSPLQGVWGESWVSKKISRDTDVTRDLDCTY